MASVSNLYKGASLRWHPDADAVNAPEGSLLRADNMMPDTDGAMSIRPGSSKVYSGLGTNVHSLHTVELANGTTYRMVGADDSLLINGVQQATDITGSGDLAFGDDSYQVFAARGTTKLKWDGTKVRNWGIAAPVAAPTLAAVASITKSVATFDASESPAVVVAEGTGAAGNATDYDGTASAATQITPNTTTYRSVVTRTYASAVDYMDISGVAGSETDLIDLFVKFENPRDIEKVTIVFGMNAAANGPFVTDRYEFTFDLTKGLDIPNKDLASEGYSAYAAAVINSLGGVSPADVSGVQTPNQVKNTIAGVGSTPSPKTQPPPDNVWGHLTITRGQFTRVGSTTGCDWSTITAFKVVVENKKGKTSKTTLAAAIVVGGGDRALTGTYRCVIRGVREFKDNNGETIYYELSPPSPQSDPIILNHQTLQITINSSTLLQLDEQVGQIWVYLFGGWLDAYYRFAVVASEVDQGMSPDDLTSPNGSDFGSVLERAKIASWGFSYSQLNGGGVPSLTASNDLVITLRKNELAALTENIRLEPYQITPPDNIVDIAGPWKGRMFVMTQEGFVYPSSQKNPSSFNSLQVIDLARFGDPLWIAKTGSGVVCGCEKDVVFIGGSGDESPDGATSDLYPVPLNVGNPPIDACHWVEGNAVIYRSADGMMQLTGSSITPVPMAGTSLLWRGQTRHGVEGMNVSGGRFRCAVDNFMLYVLVPEGANTTGNAVYRYSTEKGQWSRLLYPQAGNFLSIINEPSGLLVAGDDEGVLWLLDTGTQDHTSDIWANILTPIEDGGAPLAYKDPMDLQIHCDTSNDVATVNVYIDGEVDAVATYSAFTDSPSVWRTSASDVGVFNKLQLGLTGNFNNFRLHAFNLSYRVRPQHMSYLDCGYIEANEPGDLVWLQEVEADCNAEADMTMKVYVEDELWHTANVGITPDVRTVYRLPLPRGTKGFRLRVTFETTNAAGEGRRGFEMYSVRARATSTGNKESSRQYIKLWPAGQAP